MADFSYMIDSKIKTTIDNKLNPYIKMIRERMRDIDNKSTNSVLQVKNMLDEFLIEYNQFRNEVSVYVENLEGVSEKLEEANTLIETMETDIKKLKEDLLKAQTDLTGLTNTYNNHLTKKYYAVSHYVNGGSNVKNYSIIEGQSISAPSTKRDGYDFLGWYSDEDFSNKITFPLVINDNYDLYAQWKEIVYYTVTFITPYGTVEPVRVKGGETVSLPTLEQDGYRFQGWYADENFENELTSPITVESDITVYAKWQEIIYYTVTYITGYDTTVAPVTVEENTIISLPILAREDYSFDGWIDSNGNQVASPYKVTSNMTLTAQWTSTSIIYTYMSEMPVRYVRSSCSRNDMNSPRWQFIKVYSGGKNIAPGKTVTANFNYEQVDGTTSDINRVVTEDTNMFHSPNTVYYAAVTIDLGDKYNIEKIIINQNNNSYHSYQNNVIDISPDGVNWYVVSSSVFSTSEDGWGERTRDLTTRLFRTVSQALPLVANAWALTPIRYIKYKTTSNFASSTIGITNLQACDWYQVPITPISCVNLNDPDFDTTPITDNNSSTTTALTVKDQIIFFDLGKEYNLGLLNFVNNTDAGITIEVSPDNVNYEQLYYHASRRNATINLLTTAKA